jgi:hypothetical protein
VVVAFFEHLPTSQSVREDMHRWVPPDVFHALEKPFRYFLSEEEFVALGVSYRTRRAAWLGER